MKTLKDFINELKALEYYVYDCGDYHSDVAVPLEDINHLIYKYEEEMEEK